MAITSLIDGSFQTPIECEGSPEISTDPVTTAKIVRRKYVVLKKYYQPLPEASVDPFFKDCYLINETQDQQKGSFVWFSRNYWQLPPLRIEPRLISFTFPGQSLVTYSAASGMPIGWDAHGFSNPSTKPVLAEVDYSYAVRTDITQNPFTLFSGVPIPTFPVYNGVPVDYIGTVAQSVGTRTLSNGTTEPAFKIVGAVALPNAIGNWIVSSDIKRLQGPIFELEVVYYRGGFTFTQNI